MRSTPITSRLWIVAFVVVAIGSLFLGACGDGSDTRETPTVQDSPTQPAPTDDVSSETVQVDASFWHAGWKVTLGEATLSQNEQGILTVTIAATFESLSNRTATINSQLALTSGGNSFDDSGTEEDLPNVPGGLSGTGLFAIQVDDTFTLDDATLIVGNQDNNRAIVPIGPNSPDALVSLEPLRIAASGSAAAGPVSFTLTGVEVRADLPDWLDEVEEGRLAMIVSFEVTVGEGIPIGEGVFQSDNVALILPGGTAVAVRSDGRSGVNELLQGKEGTTIQDLSVRFIIAGPAEGEYSFLVRGPYGLDREQVEGEVTFVIPAP